MRAGRLIRVQLHVPSAVRKNDQEREIREIPSMHTQTLSGRAASFGTRHLVSALSAMLLGLALVLTVGFAPVQAMHNAAHDTRHSASFPCH